MFEKSIARVEALLKGMVFDCHACGQCVLRQTALICPMSCPKGLRNGPCGGTLNGECEVYPDKPCVWVRIHKRRYGDRMACPTLLPAPDAGLFNTSSYLNRLSGHDQKGRTPLPYLDLGAQRTAQPPATLSRLERRLKSGAFVRMCEIRAPRSGNLDQLRRQVEKVRDHVDAMNATAYLNARPSLPSAVAAAQLVRMGVEPVCQATCRDHTRTSFISELIQNQMNQVHNVLCLTGDSYTGVPRIKQVFDMDAALMIYEARYLRETGTIHFTGEAMDDPPRPFLGGAINPFSTPTDVPVRRMMQKVAAGVDFTQTQVIFDVDRFARFMELLQREGVTREVFVIAGVPVVTSARALALLPRIPGVYLPETVRRDLQAAPDCQARGIALAQETVRQLRQVPGVAGVHLMLFGPDYAALPEVLEGALPHEPRPDGPDAPNSSKGSDVGAKPTGCHAGRPQLPLALSTFTSATAREICQSQT